MTPDFDTLKARIEAIAAFADGLETVLTGDRCSLLSAALPALEVVRPRRATRVRPNYDTLQTTYEWEAWEFVAEICDKTNADLVAAALDEASARLDAVPTAFLARRRLELDDSGIVWDTEPMRSDVGQVERDGKNWAAVRHVLPVILDEEIP